MKYLFLLLAVLGTIVPYIFFARFMIEQGTDLGEFVRALFANPAASGFTADLLITSTAFWIWSFFESRSNGMRHWWVFVVLNLTVGLSCAFPLFLYFRQTRMESVQNGRTAREPAGQALSHG